MVAKEPETEAISPVKPEPHPGAAAVAIAGMAVAVAAVFSLVGLAPRMDAAVAEGLRRFGLEGELRPLPEGWVWSWTVVATVAVCQAMLHVIGHWRRTVIAVLAILLTLSWVPVLALAAYAASLGPVLVALGWGIGSSMIYAVRHREPK